MGLKITNLPISNYITAYPISVEPDVPAMKAIEFMAERGIGNLVVSDGMIPKGVLTEREILKAVAESNDLRKLKVRELGWQPYIKLALGNTVLDAAHLMTKKKSRLLIFDEDKMVGITTVTDLMRAFRKTSTDVVLEEVMSTSVEKCKFSDPILSIVKTMHEKRIGSVIVDNVEGYGIFTERDLLWCLTSNVNLNEEVGKYASSPLIVAEIGIKAHQAANVMAANNVKRLGLIKNNSLAGMVTARDLVDAYQSVYQVSNPYLDEFSEYVSG